MEAVRTVSFAVAMEQLLKSKQMQPFEDISAAPVGTHLARRRAVPRAGPQAGQNQWRRGDVHRPGARPRRLLPDVARRQFPELVADKAELHALLVGWHDNIGHALLSALGSPESVLEAVRTTKPIARSARNQDLSDVLYVANKIANRTSSWRDPEFDGGVDTSMLDTCSMPRRWPKSSRSRKRKCSR
jgi:hypothetical protein